MSSRKKIFFFIQVFFLLLSTTGVRASIHHCLHHLNEGEDISLSVFLTFSEEECKHHHETHPSPCSAKKDTNCAHESDCCVSNVYFIQLDIDATLSKSEDLERSFLTIPTLYALHSLNHFSFSLYPQQKEQRFLYQDDFLENRTHQSFLSQFLI